MNLPDSLLSNTTATIGWLALVIALWLTARRAPWRAVWHVPLRLHLILTSIAFLSFLWLLRADTLPGLSLHFLGLTAITLLIGWPFALIAGTLALIILVLLGYAGMAGLGIDFWGMIVPPVAVTVLISHGAQRFLPANFFVYLFVDVFLSALLGVLAAAVTSSLMMMALGLYTWDTLWQSYLALSLLQTIPEGIVNGMIMTALALLVPTWVISFDEKHYFSG
jgi:uncharacterized membrane protein